MEVKLNSYILQMYQRSDAFSDSYTLIVDNGITLGV